MLIQSSYKKNQIKASAQTAEAPEECLTPKLQART